MKTLRSVLCLTAGVAVLLFAGCSATRGGKCKTCESMEVYPTQPYYSTVQPYDSGTMSSPQYTAPAPIPAAEPMPLPPVPGQQPAPPPPPADAGIHARPIREAGATTRGLYNTMNSNIRAMFTR